MRHLPSLAFILASIAACSAQDPVDGRDDSFTTDGKLDGFTCTPAEAAAILKVANEAPGATLRNDVQLAQNAVTNILAVRAGDDETTGTADDASFGTLAQLDAVPFLGPVAFQALLDYVHAADLVDDTAAREWTTTTIANGSGARFALAPDGGVAVSFFSNNKFYVRLPDGALVELPAGVSGPEVAVDGAGVVHLFSGDYTANRHKHYTVHGTALTQHADLVDAKYLDVDNGPDGQIYALSRWPSTTGDDTGLTLFTINANGTNTSEQLWSLASNTQIAFNIDRDGYPALAWGGGYLYPTALGYARRGPGGWTQPLVSSQTVRASEVATAGTADAIMFVGYAKIRVYDQNGGTFAAPTEINHIMSLNGSMDAQQDDQGVTHLCATTQDGTLHVQIDATGAISETVIGTGGCQLAVDASGKLHRLWSVGSVINHAVFE